MSIHQNTLQLQHYSPGVGHIALAMSKHLVGRQCDADRITRGSSTRHQTAQPNRTLNLLAANADVSQNLLIETQQLKARLIKLQPQLRQLMVQAELSWMRCFTEPRTAPAYADALEMVQLGEKLTSSLSHAFNLVARTATASVLEYQALESSIESNMITFQTLVTRVGHSKYTHPENQVIHVANEDERVYANEHNEEGKAKPTTYLNRPITVDLPSMRTYCKHAAPPYSSYLPPLTAIKVPTVLNPKAHQVLVVQAQKTAQP